MSATDQPRHFADSEVGTLRTVMLHRPGDELRRLTPRNNDRLLFDGLPWVSRAQEEHDAFAEALRARGVEVLYLTERASFRLTPQGVEVFEIAPGIDLQRDVLDQMEFKPLIAADLKTLEATYFKAKA